MAHKLNINIIYELSSLQCIFSFIFNYLIDRDIAVANVVPIAKENFG